MSDPLDNALEIGGASAIAARVLEIVIDHTGYPADLLDMDLELDADLGIDSVTQAEVFATVRETYGIKRDDRVQPRDYRTVGHLVDFVVGSGREPAAQASPSAAAALAAD